MRMRMLKENPRYNIVSLRVSDEELSAIKVLLQREHMTISDLMRDALQVVRLRLEESEGRSLSH